MPGRLMLAAVGLAAVVALSGCRFIINEGEQLDVRATGSGRVSRR